MMMLSPLTMSVPRELDLSATISSAFSRERFMCWSKPWREPRITFPPFSLIRTTFPRLVSSTLIAMSADIVSNRTGRVWASQAGFIKLTYSPSPTELKRQVVSKHDSRELIAEIEGSTGVHLEVPRSAQVEILEPDEETKFVIIDGRFTFVSTGTGGGYLPYVGSSDAVGLFPSVSIDEGALKYIIKGADVMRPGISKYDDWGDAGKL